MKAFLFDRIVKTKAKKMKEETKMNNKDVVITVQVNEENVKMGNVTFVDKVRTGWAKFKENKYVAKTVTTVKKVVKATYEFSKDFVKKHWKDATLATASTLAAGAMTTTGLSGSLVGGWMIYATLKAVIGGVRYLFTGNKDILEESILMDSLKYLGFASAFAAFVWYVAPFLLDEALAAWVYALVWVFA